MNSARILKLLVGGAFALAALSAIGYERSLAWLGAQAEHDAQMLQAGAHPLSVDFVARSQLPSAEVLIGQHSDPRVSVHLSAAGLQVRSDSASLALKPNWNGQRLQAEQVSFTSLEFVGLEGSSVELFLIAVAEGNGPRAKTISSTQTNTHAVPTLGHYVAELPAAQWQNLDLWSLRFAPRGSSQAGNAVQAGALANPDETSLHWAQLGTIHHLQLYVQRRTSSATKPLAFTWKKWLLHNSRPTEWLSLQTGMDAPERLLERLDQPRFLNKQPILILQSDYRGVWFNNASAWSVLAAGYATLLLGFALWFYQRRIAALGTGPASGLGPNSDSHTALLFRTASARLFFLLIALVVPWFLLQWGDHQLFATEARPRLIAMLVLILLSAAALARAVAAPVAAQTTEKTPNRTKHIGAFLAVSVGVAGALLLSHPEGAWSALAQAQRGWKLVIGYVLFAAFQQWLLQHVILRAFERLFCGQDAIRQDRQAWAVLAAATCFALLHTPNFALMLLCFAAALGWCASYLRLQRLWPLVLSHALLGWMAVVSLQPTVLRGADVGVRYFHTLPP